MRSARKQRSASAGLMPSTGRYCAAEVLASLVREAGETLRLAGLR
jgi:hypothetical protein